MACGLCFREQRPVVAEGIEIEELEAGPDWIEGSSSNAQLIAEVKGLQNRPRPLPPSRGEAASSNGGFLAENATLLDMAQLICYYVVTLILAKRAPGGKKPQLSVNSWFASKGRFSKSSKTRETG